MENLLHNPTQAIHNTDLALEFGLMSMFKDLTWNLWNYKSGGNRKLKQAAAVGFPGTFLNVDWPWRWFTSRFIGCHASQALVHAPCTEVLSESRQLLVQVGGVPKEELVQIFAAYGPNEPFHLRILGI